MKKPTKEEKKVSLPRICLGFETWPLEMVDESEKRKENGRKKEGEGEGIRESFFLLKGWLLFF